MDCRLPCDSAEIEVAESEPGPWYVLYRCLPRDDVPVGETPGVGAIREVRELFELHGDVASRLWDEPGWNFRSTPTLTLSASSANLFSPPVWFRSCFMTSA